MGPTPGRRPSPWKCQLRRRGSRFHLENSGRWGSSGSPVPHGQAVRAAALGLGCLRHPDRDLGSHLLSCPSEGRVFRPLSAWELAEWSRLELVCIRLRGVAVSRRQLCQQSHCHGHPQRDPQRSLGEETKASAGVSLAEGPQAAGPFSPASACFSDEPEGQCESRL